MRILLGPELPPGSLMLYSSQRQHVHHVSGTTNNTVSTKNSDSARSCQATRPSQLSHKPGVQKLELSNCPYR